MAKLRIRDDDELLEEYCRRLPEHLRKDKGYKREIAQTSEYQQWWYRERCKDIYAKADELMTY